MKRGQDVAKRVRGCFLERLDGKGVREPMVLLLVTSYVEID